jgi:alpha-1,6-mannosyltransferase
MLPQWSYRLLLFVAVLVHFSLAYWTDRADPLAVLGSFGLMWVVFLMQWANQKIGAKQMIALGLLLRAVWLPAVPQLSDDVFRYVWDGMLLNEGVSPYGTLPSEWMRTSPNVAFQELFTKLNSPDYHSIYPPVLQGIFALSVWLGNGELLSSIIMLRMFVLVAEFGSMFLIWKLLEAWKMNTRNLMLYAFNPLVIIEFSGSLHGEVFMVFFLLLSLWFLTSSSPSLPELEYYPTPDPSPEGRGAGTLIRGLLGARLPSWKGGVGGGLLLSAVAFGLSVGTKLLPLMFLPFYIKRLGWMRTIVYGTVAILTAAMLYVPFWTPDLVANTLSSMHLYFAKFEFNASFYYVIREVGFWVKGYNIIGQTAVWLPRLVLLSILLIALLNKDRSVSGLPKLILFAWFIYYALATTVNPWYVAVLAAFLPFTKYRFALVWLMLVPLSYHAFGHADYRENLWVVSLEYVPVYLWLLFELNVFKAWERKWALKRAEVKRKRLLPLLSEGGSVLEVGAGNGALTKLLREEGMKTTALDIADKSLFADVKVEVYDGEKFPFGEKKFDVCQLITMLHHTTNAEALIREAGRVSDRVIIMEDIYENRFQQWITWFTDSLVNWEFYGHPHTNRTDAEWKELFERNGLKLEKVEYYRFLLLFRQVMYVLKK